jgi:hypothetical protein
MSLKAHRRHGEAGSAVINDESERIMEEIREEGKKYEADCIYNFDETGYYWKMKPDRSLTTFEESGRKKDKARVTVGLTCNATGTDRLPLWFIGTANRPHCFRSEHLTGLDTIGAVWRHNKTAWMNHYIMKEYLLWFDQRMRSKGKKVLLLMDNFSAHELAAEQIENGVVKLTNTKVMWLPPNATSIYQPLDQGIIQNWKSYVKRQFVIFMARTFDEGKDLSKEMHVLRAIRWGISAWENDVTPATIQNCWARSQAVNFGQFPLPASDIWTESQQLVDDIRMGIYRMKQRGYLVEIPNIHDYISPYAKQVTDNFPEDLVDDIVAQYTQEEIEEEGEEEVLIPLPLVTHEEALNALHILRRYEEENQYNGLELLRQLRTHEREISTRLISSKKQGRLDQWVVRSRGGSDS